MHHGSARTQLIRSLVLAFLFMPSGSQSLITVHVRAASNTKSSWCSQSYQSDSITECSSIQSAVEVVRKQRLGGRSSSAMIYLLPNSSCDMSSVLEFERGRLVVLDHLLYNVSISKHPDSECKSVSLGNTHYPYEHPVMFLHLGNVSGIVIRGIKFHVHVNSTAIKIINSALVKVEDCSFVLHSHWPDATVIEVASSQSVFLVSCSLRRAKSSRPPLQTVKNGKLNTFFPPVLIENMQPGNTFKSVSIDTALKWLSDGVNLEVSFLIRRLQKRLDEYQQRSTSRAVVLSTALLGCSFEDIGVDLSEYTSLELSINSLKGAAVEVRMKPSGKMHVVVVDNCTFSRVTGPESSALAVKFWASDVGRACHQDTCPGMHDFTISMQHILISNCVFLDNTGLAGGALSIKFYHKGVNSSVEISDCLFEGNRARQAGGAVFLRYSGVTPRDNNVLFLRCRFVMNEAGLVAQHFRRTGSAVMLIAKRPVIFQNWRRELLAVTRCPVDLRGSYFYGNKGFGALYSRSVATFFSSSTVIDGSEGAGTGVVAVDARLIFDGTVSIVHNTGLFGGAIHVALQGVMNFSQVTDLRIQNNSAETGDMVYIDDVSSRETRDILNVYVGKRQYTNFSECPILLPVESDAPDGAVIELDNHAHSIPNNSFHGPAIFSASWHKCFGVFDLIPQHFAGSDEEESYVHVPYCAPYPPRDWSYMTERVEHYEVCRDTGYAVSSKVSVNETNSFLIQPTVCHSFCQNITVVDELDLFKDVINTFTAWLFFRGSSTSCYKEVDDKIWFFNDCQRDSIFKFALQARNLAKYDCSVHVLPMIVNRYSRSLVPVLPGYRLLLMPWASLMHEWDDYPVNESAEAQSSVSLCNPEGGSSINDSPRLGDITLYPAPGERFDLSLDVADEFLSISRGKLHISVKTPTDNVLLGHEGFCGLDKKVFYSSVTDLSGLFLAGVPGSTGHLKIVFDDSTSIRHLNRVEFKVHIPFRLRQCPPGFKDPLINSSREAAKYAKTFRGTAKPCSAYPPSKGDEFRLICRCPQVIEGVHRCRHGKEILVDGGYWAGQYTQERVSRPNASNSCIFGKEDFFQGKISKGEDACGVEAEGPFIVGRCDNGLCDLTFGEGTWATPAADPCWDESHRTGPLCGFCEAGYDVLISSEVCHNCAGRYTLSLHAYFLLEFLLSLALFIILLFLNIGIAPTLNSWLLFMQVVLIIYGENVTLRTVFSSIMTLGLGLVCMKKPLTRLQAKAATLAHPLYMILFMFSVWFAIRRGICAKHLQYLQKRNTLAHVVWLCVIYCSISMAYVCTSLLASTPMSRLNGDDQYMLFLDGSIELFSSRHMPFAMAAILLFVLFVLPAPVVLAVPRLRSLAQFKWYADEAISLYETDYHWWAAVDLCRRVLLSGLAGGIINTRLRHFATALICVVMLAAQTALRPLRRRKLWRIDDIDNRFESMLLFILCFIAVARVGASCPGWPVTLSGDFTTILYIFFISWVTFLSIALSGYRFFHSWGQTFGLGATAKRWYTFDKDDEANEKEHGSFASPSTSAHASVSASDGGSGAGIDAAGPRERPIDMRRMDFQPVPNGLRDPLLADFLAERWPSKSK